MSNNIKIANNSSVTANSEQIIPKKKVRDSNLELYRIIVMLLIVAHHYVVNSGLMDYIKESPLSITSTTMLIFGAWGKTGINCFVFITGYFMCKSSFTWEKLLKLYLQILFYAIIIYGIFCITGHENFSAFEAAWKLWPVKSIASGFTSCFILFFLFIPFLNIFIQALDKSSFRKLCILITVVFAILPSIPLIPMAFNYVTWFMVIYLLAAYVRIYGFGVRFSHKQWGWLSIALILLGSLTVLGLEAIYKLGYTTHYIPYYCLSDSNKFLSLAIAVSSFMYFKGISIPYSRFINAVGGATFGVLLIHANSDAMRQWLWKETIDCVGHFESSLVWTLGYATISVLIIFVICAGIDWFRGKYIEPHLIQSVHRLFSSMKSFATRKYGEGSL